MTIPKQILDTMMEHLYEASDEMPEGIYLILCNDLKALNDCCGKIPTPKVRRCGYCREPGHIRTNCPHVPRSRPRPRPRRASVYSVIVSMFNSTFNTYTRI